MTWNHRRQGPTPVPPSPHRRGGVQPGTGSGNEIRRPLRRRSPCRRGRGTTCDPAPDHEFQTSSRFGIHPARLEECDDGSARRGCAARRADMPTHPEEAQPPKSEVRPRTIATGSRSRWCDHDVSPPASESGRLVAESGTAAMPERKAQLGAMRSPTSGPGHDRRAPDGLVCDCKGRGCARRLGWSASVFGWLLARADRLRRRVIVMCDSRAECWRTWGSRCRTILPDKLHRSRMTPGPDDRSCMDARIARTNTCRQIGGRGRSSGGTLGEKQVGQIVEKTSYGGHSKTVSAGSALMGIAIVSGSKAPTLSMDHTGGENFRPL